MWTSETRGLADTMERTARFLAERLAGWLDGLLDFVANDPGQAPTKLPVVPAHEHAAAILLGEPEINPVELAERVGVDKSTLYRKNKKWNPVRLTLMARPKDQLPRGDKDSHGNINAYE